MGLNVILSLLQDTKSEKQIGANSNLDNPVSIFNFDNIKEYKEELALVGSIATVGLIGLSIIGRKNISYFLNQRIKFKNLEEARKFGKTKIINALKKNEPYEQLIIIDKKTSSIVAQAKGKKDYIKTDAFEIVHPSGSFSVEHGHPTCCLINDKAAAMPLSFDDYATSIWNYGAEDVIAYDINGKYSRLTRSPSFKRLSSKAIKHYSDIHIQIYDDVYLKKMLEHLPKEFHHVTSGKQLSEIYRSLKSNNRLTKDLDIKFQQAFNELNKECPELLYGIDKFWRTYANDLGVIYKSNYEYLKLKSNGCPKGSFEQAQAKLNLLFKLTNSQILSNLSNENKRILKEAILKNDFKTIEKIYNECLKMSILTDDFTRNSFIKGISEKLARTNKKLNDSEISNLAVLLGTTDDQIKHMDKKEYRRLCLKFHPDKNPNDTMAHQIFIILNKIFQGQTVGNVA